MKIVVIIPARFNSSRFPGKPLIPILGKPMIVRVAELISKLIDKDDIYVATDDIRIKEVVEKNGYNIIMTSPNLLTGTDRVYEAIKSIEADIFLNVQGDELIFNISDIIKVIDAKKEYPAKVINGMCQLGKSLDPDDVNIPKVITTEDHSLVYMSRRALPGYKSEDKRPKKYFKQVCIYAFNRNELNTYGELGRKTYLERYEDIEILRFIDLNIPVHMVELSGKSAAVDIPDDIKRAETALKKNINDRL